MIRVIWLMIYAAFAVLGAAAMLRPRRFLKKKEYDSESLDTAIRATRVSGLIVTLLAVYRAAVTLLALIGV